jgi:hypothetical protein
LIAERYESRTRVNQALGADMDEAAAPQAAQSKTIADHELDALRFGWGEAYTIAYSPEDGWRAKRRDSLGGDITADCPSELWQAIRSDYTLKPVPRDYSRPLDTGDDDLPPGRALRDTDSDEAS